ncbi:Leucine-rich repeat [Carpediemonas membranifera]|uniref:Leucine-rich repeat n=1 Tax=Carpediemonas membranifera TaxID=201153 RepID=A0A8J6BU29_9EUKA|nr:Leucine-rich repeat [Carpediemonas membranifera]|eukprot:KAG9389916.1 Leucine-rich repeat [Carpediemonas membranifera]
MKATKTHDIGETELILNGPPTDDELSLDSRLNDALETVVITDREVESVAPILSLKFLESLTINRCNLTELPPMEPSPSLEFLNLNENEIDLKSLNQAIESGLLAHVRVLNLEQNFFPVVPAISNAEAITDLSLAYNKLTALSSLPRNTLQLDLSHNQLYNADLLRSLVRLRTVSLSDNELSSVPTIPPSVCTLDLSNNQLASTTDLRLLAEMPMLRTLDVRGNPLCQEKDYRLAVIYHLQGIGELDGEAVSVEDRVAAINMFERVMAHDLAATAVY